MRHQKAGRKLKRTASHRKATLNALSLSLITTRKIKTTVAKAKEVRKVVEPMVARAQKAVAAEAGGKAKNVHARREAYKVLKSRKAVSQLFDQIAPKVGDRKGGYLRVVKLGHRYGDGADIAFVEFVDFNVAQEQAAAKAKAKAAKAAKNAPKEEATAPAAENQQQPS